MRAFLAAAAAGGALMTMGAAATASTTPVPYAPIATSGQAGYVATQNTFRYVITTVKVPAVNSHASTYAEVVLGGSGNPATLGVKAGGGTGSIAWNVVGPLGGMAGGTMSKITPKVGDIVTLSIYYNKKSGLDNFTATDVTQKVSQMVTAPPSPHQVYKAAEVACALNGKVTAPKYATRLWGFTGSHVTTLAGTRGTMNGPWLTRKIIAVARDGHTVMSPSALWDSGRAFGVWLRVAK